MTLHSWNDLNLEGGETPLHWASLEGHQNIVSLLLLNGADATIKNTAEQTPLDVATDNQVRALLKGIKYSSYLNNYIIFRCTIANRS
jgi:ankyrin repeat protein